MARLDTSPSKPEVTFLPNKVAAGFPSPGEDLAGIGVDLNEFLINNPTSTFMVRVAGDSMIDAGIYEDDVLVVDRARTPSRNKIVIAVVDGGFTVKQYTFDNGVYYLSPANPKYPKIKVTEDVTIWGVVISMMRKF